RKLAVAGVIGIAVAFLAAPSQAPSMLDTSTSVVVSAKTLSLSPSGNGALRNDASATGGVALLMWSNSTATGHVTTTSAITSFAIRFKATLCNGGAALIVRVDGTAIMQGTETATTWDLHSVALSRAAGTHTFTVQFTNDYYASSTCDRNLYVDAATFTVS